MSVPPESVTPPSPPPPPSDEGAPPSNGMPSHEERQWALFGHLSALLGALLTGHLFGMGCFIGPLVIWLLKKESMPFAADQAKEALNFNITLAIIFAVLWILTIATFLVGAVLTIPLAIIISVAALVFIIIAAIKANEGERYRYPFALRLVK